MLYNLERLNAYFYHEGLVIATEGKRQWVKHSACFAYTSAQDVLRFTLLRKSPRAYAVEVSEFGSDDTQTATPRS